MLGVAANDVVQISHTSRGIIRETETGFGNILPHKLSGPKTDSAKKVGTREREK